MNTFAPGAIVLTAIIAISLLMFSEEVSQLGKNAQLALYSTPALLALPGLYIWLRRRKTALSAPAPAAKTSPGGEHLTGDEIAMLSAGAIALMLIAPLALAVPLHLLANVPIGIVLFAGLPTGLAVYLAWILWQSRRN